MIEFPASFRKKALTAAAVSDARPGTNGRSGGGVCDLAGIASISVQAAEGIAMSVASPLRVLAAPLVLVAVAVLACYLPTRRSATIDPLAALREE